MLTQRDLYGYQKYTIKRMIEEPHLALFLDMGLGKTAITLHVIRHLIKSKQIKTVLLFGPLSVIYNVWEDESKKWEYTRGLTFSILHGPDKDTRIKSDADIHLINYDGMKWLEAKLAAGKRYDMVVFDESTMLKSASTVRFKKIKRYLPSFRRRYILTGTPVPNSLLSIWSQMYLVDLGRSLGTAFTTFRRRYFRKVSDYIWVPEDKNIGAEIFDRIKHKVVRLKADDFIDMPKIIYKDIKIELPDKVQELIKVAERDLFVSINDSDVTIVNRMALSMKVRQILQGGIYTEDGYELIHRLKAEALKDFINALDGEPVIVAIQFKFELELLRSMFKGYIPYVGGGDGLTQVKLKKVLAQWNKKEVPVLACHPDSLSYGNNLQAGGHNICFLALTWNKERYDQLIGRLARNGQPSPFVTVTRILVKQGFDDLIMRPSLTGKDKTEKDFVNRFEHYLKQKGNYPDAM